MAFKAVALVSCLALVTRGQVSKIRDDLKQCSTSGRDLNGCLTDLAVAIKPYIKTGIPELGIPQADPLILDEIAFDLKNPIIDVHVDFTDNKVTGQKIKTFILHDVMNALGLSEHDLLYIRADRSSRTIEMSMFIPASKSVGKYVIEGKVAVLELEAYDPAAYVTEFTNTTVTGKAQLNIRDNRVVIDEDPDITIDVGGLNIKMDNLFNGQADQLAKTVDKFLNQNTDKFIKDFQPAIAKSVSGFLKGFYNGAVRNIDVSLFQ